MQAAITTRYHGHTPADLEQCYPEYFPDVDRASPDTVPEAAEQDGWEEENWPALRTGTKWYPGWIRRYFYEEGLKANKWAGATRWLYHLGVLALLLGLSALVAPPADAAGWRWALFSIALGGALAEAGWIAVQSSAWAAVRSWTRAARRRRHLLQRRLTPSDDRGGRVSGP